MDGDGGRVAPPLGVRCPGFLDCDIKVLLVQSSVLYPELLPLTAEVGT